MAYIVLYWGIMLVGYAVGSKLRMHKDKFRFINGVMLFSVSFLVLLMGIRMGSDEEVIANLGTIGIQSLLISLLLMAGTVCFMILTRRLVGLDRYGRLKRESAHEEIAAEGLSEEAACDEENKSSNLMTWLILLFVVVGLLLGYFVVRVKVVDIDGLNDIMGTMMTVGLTVMLFFIGLDMGLAGTVVAQLKNVGLRVFIFPFAVLLATAVMGVLIGLIFPDLTPKTSLAVCFGFGWYTFAPVAIANAGYTIAGAISFMHNVIREIGGIVLIPLIAKKVGYIESTSLPGVAAMDICMPIVAKATRPDIMVYSFTIGMLESVTVSILVPLFVSL